jgi:hypothetical protein
MSFSIIVVFIAHVCIYKKDNSGISSFVEDVNLWMKGTYIHEFHKNWAIRNSNDSTVMMSLSLRAPNDDYTPANLQTVTDNIYLNLFDQVLIDIQEVCLSEK